MRNFVNKGYYEKPKKTLKDFYDDFVARFCANCSNPVTMTFEAQAQTGFFQAPESWIPNFAQWICQQNDTALLMSLIAKNPAVIINSNMLMYVLERGDLRIAGYLLKQLQQSNLLPSLSYITPNGLLLLQHCKTTPALELVLSFGPNVNAHNMYGDTPLHYFVKEGDPAFLKVLVQHGADPLLSSVTPNPLFAKNHLFVLPKSAVERALAEKNKTDLIVAMLHARNVKQVLPFLIEHQPWHTALQCLPMLSAYYSEDFFATILPPFGTQEIIDIALQSLKRGEICLGYNLIRYMEQNDEITEQIASKLLSFLLQTVCEKEQEVFKDSMYIEASINILASYTISEANVYQFQKVCFLLDLHQVWTNFGLIDTLCMSASAPIICAFHNDSKNIIKVIANNLGDKFDTFLVRNVQELPVANESVLFLVECDIISDAHQFFPVIVKCATSNRGHWKLMSTLLSKYPMATAASILQLFETYSNDIQLAIFQNFRHLFSVSQAVSAISRARNVFLARLVRSKYPASLFCAELSKTCSTIYDTFSIECLENNLIDASVLAKNELFVKKLLAVNLLNGKTLYKSAELKLQVKVALTTYLFERTFDECLHEFSDALHQLHYFVRCNDISAVKSLLCYTSFSNQLDSCGRNALCLASSADMASVLVNHNATLVHSVDIHGNTPLMNVLLRSEPKFSTQDIETFIVLIKAGSNILKQNVHRESPLLFFCKMKRLYGKAVERKFNERFVNAVTNSASFATISVIDVKNLIELAPIAMSHHVMRLPYCPFEWLELVLPVALTIYC